VFLKRESDKERYKESVLRGDRRVSLENADLRVYQTRRERERESARDDVGLQNRSSEKRKRERENIHKCRKKREYR